MSRKKFEIVSAGTAINVEDLLGAPVNLAKDMIDSTIKYRETYGPILGDRISEEDKSYFEKFGNSIADQMEVVAWESNLDSETMSEKFEELINNINNLSGDNAQYYIVETAQLACSMQMNEEQTLHCKNGIIKSIPNMERESEKGKTKLISQLQIPEDRPIEYGLHKPAVVTDTKGGLRGEIRIVKQESGTAKGVNIISFGNCQYIQNGTIVEEELAQELYDSIPTSERGAALAEIEERMIKAIEQGYGTCHCFMKLESEWENFPEGLSLDSGSLYYDATKKESIQQFNNVEAINMMSMLFCKRGGIITPLHSGQIIYTGIEDIFTDLEKKLMENFPQTFDYDNWSEVQKSCARARWERLYDDGKGDFDAYFVAGMIGNMFGEGGCGQLQYNKDWKQYDKTLDDGMTITNRDQAEAACSSASDMGIGMFQFSNKDVKEILLENYKEQSNEDGTLGIEQLINAEVKTIQEELNGRKESVYSNYQEAAQEVDNIGDIMILSTTVFFKDYEIGSGSSKINGDTYLIDPSVWKAAIKAEKIDDVPTICQRIIAAKVVLEEFMKVEDDDIK